MQMVDYKMNHNSYSVGGNYRISENLAAFARVSDGVAFNADRILFGTPLDGSAPININTVKQIEGGVKWRSGGVSTFVTLFQAKTDESNYEATTQRALPTSTTPRAWNWKAPTAGQLPRHRRHDLHRCQDRRHGSSGCGQHRQHAAPPGQVVYQIMPRMTSAMHARRQLIGTGKSWGDDAHTIVLPAYQVVHAFVNYNLTPKTTLSLSVNNLFNKIGYTEVEGDGHAARSISGRAAKVGLSYAF
jgi:outer membrane receptor protein involved in Fe transport